MEEKRYEIKTYLERFGRCMQKEIPYCEAACPFHIPVFDFVAKVQRGAFKAAFRTYRDYTGFPRIAASLCTAPCKTVCPGKENERAIELLLLEQAAIALTQDMSATDYNLPAKKGNIAIIGAGLSGMAACLRLSTKKYSVHVFEAKDRIGGSLWDLMPSEIFLADFEQQLEHQEYELCLNTEIKDIKQLENKGFDAVYVATGKGGADFGLLTATGDFGDSYCMRMGNTGVFAGGALTGDEPVYALAAGLHIGTVIDNFIKTGNLYYPKNEKTTRMCEGMVSPEAIADKIAPKDGEGYSEDEAKSEAARCLRCRCDACKNNCDILEFTDKWPLRIKDEVLATTLEGKSELKATPAKRLMFLCNQCGLCKEICPEEIDVEGLFLAGRVAMHRQKKTPWPFHDFWLRDMQHAKECGITRPPNGKDSCSHAFFPGCQLGAGEPSLVEKSYALLLEREPDMGLMLRCCGVPLEWAGRTEQFAEEISDIKREWESLGRPKLIMACPTCVRKFKEHLSEIPVTSIYEFIAGAEGEGCEHLPAAGTKEYAVFDACSARHETEMKEAVRRLAKKTGKDLVALPVNDELNRCCGFGGHGSIASPAYKEFVTKRRADESDAVYITYCINCRDAFLEQEKDTVHILSLLFENHDKNAALGSDGEAKKVTDEGKKAKAEPAKRKMPTISRRRANREDLKKSMLKTFWGEGDDMKTDDRTIARQNITISDELLQKMNKELILESDISKTIEFCQRHNRRVFDEEDGTYTGYMHIGRMTYWVQYRQLGENDFQLVNAYCHRMKIELEAVWNGIRQETDLQ